MVDQTLTAGQGDIADPHGLPTTTFPVGYTIQWVRVDADGTSNPTNVGMNSDTYTLVAADVGKKILVKVSFTDANGNPEGPLSSEVTRTVAGNDVCTEGDVELHKSNVKVEGTEGTVRICHLNLWGDVCDDHWQKRDADVVCRQLGYAGAEEATILSEFTTLGNVRFWLDDVHCDGTETSLAQCRYNVWGANDCRAPERAGVRCTPNAAADATLSDLVVENTADDSTLLLTPEFASGTKSYAGSVTSGVARITVKPTVNESNATVEYLDGSDTAITDADTNKDNQQVALSVGDNTIKVKVTAEDNTTTDTYTVEVTRAAAGANVTGQPAISGPPQVGMTLTAGQGDIADVDGLPTTFPGDYTFQWLREGSPILGATGSTYTPAGADVTRTLKVKVSFTDNGSIPETVTSDATYAVMPAAAPKCDARTIWCATLTSGQDIDAGDVISVGFRSDESYGSIGPVSFTHLGDTYTVTGLRVAGQQDVLFSTTPDLPADGAGLTLHLQKVDGELDLPLGGAVFVMGSNWWSFERGALASVASGDGLDDASLLRIYGLDYPLRADTDTGAEVAVRLSYSGNFPATGRPVISGTAEVGQTLTASTSGISDPDGVTNAVFAYRWYRVDGGAQTAIQGATGATYTLAPADEGKQFRVKVTFTDDAGGSENRTSRLYPVLGVEGNLRLADGQNEGEGRLEVFHDGAWGTICDDGFDSPGNIAPQLACQWMGYATGEVISSTGITPASASFAILLDDVRCYEGSTH